MEEPDCCITRNKGTVVTEVALRDDGLDQVNGGSIPVKEHEVINIRGSPQSEEQLSRDLLSNGIINISETGRETLHDRELMLQNPKQDTCNEFSINNNGQDTRQNLNANLASRQTKKLYKCDQCDSGFNQKCNLKRHLKLHSGYKPFLCKECGLSFYEQDSLKKHSRTHTGEKPYKCQECDASFAHSGHLKTHRRIHSGEKPYVCQECGLSFSQAGNLKVHMRIHTGERPYVCKVCGAAFSISSVYKKHVMVHTGERPFKCTFCDAKFSSNSNLSRHNKTHTGEKPFKCQICTAAFPVKNSLDRHMKSHTWERPYCCEMCGAVFADMSDLTKHRKIHTGEKPLKCDICGMRFFSKSQMKIHIRTHTGEKPHKCHLCGVSFAQIGTLNKHKRTHTGEKPFRCDECGTLFTAKSSLKKHVERHSYNASTQNIDTANIISFQNVEAQSVSIFDIQSKILNPSSICNQETLPLSTKLLGTAALTSSVDIEDIPLNTNSDILNSKSTLPASSNGSLSVVPSLSDDHSTLIALDLGNPTQVSQSASVGGRLPVYNTLHPVNSSVPEPIVTPFRNHDTFASRNIPSLTFTELQNEGEFCSLERNTSIIHSSPPVSATLQHLHPLTAAIPTECSIQTPLSTNTSVPRLPSLQKW
ncbi:zinc finger protein 708-like isoform X1 [Homarus americanus]|uniref:zinc finger protein 708-like isoform X1 n=1 Tax=Homarus americanus TaxID=6706 RepID=UPI001C465528|nr:zinc finger protein 708-like isoform X1 [Homarus americanus]